MPDSGKHDGGQHVVGGGQLPTSDRIPDPLPAAARPVADQLFGGRNAMTHEEVAAALREALGISFAKTAGRRAAEVGAGLMVVGALVAAVVWYRRKARTN